MRKYRTNAGSTVRTDYGIALLTGLRAFPEIETLAPPFEQLNEALEGAHLARVALRKPMVQARARVRFGNYLVDQRIRMTDNGARIADGGRRGDLTIALFPDGITPVVKPKGANQIQPTEELLDRMAKCKLAKADAFRATWAPRLEQELEGLRQARKAYDDAKKAYLDAFAEELSLRAEHARQVDRLMGLVRATFPGDTDKQDVIFPEPCRVSGLPAEEDEEMEEAAGPVSSG